MKRVGGGCSCCGFGGGGQGNRIALQNGRMEWDRESLVSTQELPSLCLPGSCVLEKALGLLLSVDGTELSAREIFSLLREHGAE